QPPNDVLLSQLGTFRLKEKQAPPTPNPAPTNPPAPPTNTPVPTKTPVSLIDCNGIPDNDGVAVEPRFPPLFSRFTIKSTGWTNEYEVGVYSTMPNGQVFGAPFHVPVSGVNGGATRTVYLTVDDQTPYYGIWVVTMEGIQHHEKKYGYFKLLPRIPGTP